MSNQKVSFKTERELQGERHNQQELKQQVVSSKTQAEALQESL